MDLGISEVDEAMAAERALLSPRVRTSPELSRELLDPGFVEVGQSGRRWDRESMLTDLPSMTPTAPIEALDMRGELIAPGVVHLTYTTGSGGVRALRGSLWRRDDHGKWRLYYHQGTPAPLSTSTDTGSPPSRESRLR